jgi:hypothetical protein
VFSFTSAEVLRYRVQTSGKHGGKSPHSNRTLGSQIQLSIFPYLRLITLVDEHHLAYMLYLQMTDERSILCLENGLGDTFCIIESIE